MPSGVSFDLLHELLRQADDRKRLRFDQFMEIVLYDPTLGYYARHAERAGRAGDFLTSPEASPLFGACVSDWLVRTWDALGTDEFTLVEVGAGRGTLARTILDALPPGKRSKLTLHLVERGTAPRHALEQALAGPRTHVHANVEQLPARLGTGAFVANELFDNLPVRRLMRADGWKEIVVQVHGSQLREALIPADEELLGLVERDHIRPADGQGAEVAPQAVPLLEDLLARFDAGGLLIFDYGGLAHETSGDAAPQGTVRAYRGHGVHSDLYASLGDQDITADVNFTPLQAAAERLGFSPAELLPQGSFLMRHGLAERTLSLVESETDPMRRLRTSQLAKQLYHPEALGETHRALVAIKRR